MFVLSLYIFMKLFLTFGNLMYCVFAQVYLFKFYIFSSDATFFTRRRSSRGLPRRNIMLNNEEIPWKDECKYLGVVLDKRLTFAKHIDFVTNKSNLCMKSLYSVLNRNSRLNTSSKLLLYKSAIRPILLYAAPSWGDCAATHKKKIQIVQNRFLRMCLNLSPRHPTLETHDLAHSIMISDIIANMTTKFITSAASSENPLIEAI